MASQNQAGDLFVAQTTTGAGGRVRLLGPQHTFQVSGEMSASTGSAVVVVQVSNQDNPSVTAVSGDDAGYWITAGTITLSLTTTITSDGFAINAPWKWARFNITTLTTNGTVSCWYGTWTGQ